MAYLDHAATTPMTARVREALFTALDEFGNPSSLHATGRRARRMVEEAREHIGAALGARPSEVIFTAGGTESDNLAIKGLYWARRDNDPQRTVVLTSAVEHHAVLDAVEWLGSHEDATVEILGVDTVGRVAPATIEEALREHDSRVALASVMWANNEVGTVQPVAELAALAAEQGVPFHADAVQAIGQVPVDFGASGVTALSLTGHKIGGPRNVGALLLRREATVTPVLHGGGQERQVRSGTLDAAGIVAFSVAVTDAVAQQEQTARDLGALRDDLIRRVLGAVPEAIYNGDVDAGRLPGNAHFIFPGCEGDALLMLLDAKGVECSTGSACTAGVPQPSHVLLAMGVDPMLARSSLRFSLGHTSTKADIDELIEALPAAVDRARRAGMGR